MVRYKIDFKYEPRIPNTWLWTILGGYYEL